MITTGPVSVVGAGLSGLAAAMELARHGTPATVYEQHREVGCRFRLRYGLDRPR